jgi:hypothetical protein
VLSVKKKNSNQNLQFRVKQYKTKRERICYTFSKFAIKFPV